MDLPTAAPCSENPKLSGHWSLLDLLELLALSLAHHCQLPSLPA